MHVELHERAIADAAEAVHFARLDHEDVAGARLELAPLDDPSAAALLDELHFVVGMTMRPRAGAGLAAKQEHRNVDVALIGADEVVRAAAKRELLLADAVHGSPP